MDDPRRGGIPLRNAISIFSSYCNVGHGNFDTTTIENLINKGYAVGLVETASPHMVTVLGYDDQFYYATGNTSGNVVTYQKYDLAGSGYIYFENIKPPYK